MDAKSILRSFLPGSSPSVAGSPLQIDINVSSVSEWRSRCSAAFILGSAPCSRRSKWHLAPARAS
eukprot:8883532-Pyramimonas_sp.AAC.1